MATNLIGLTAERRVWGEVVVDCYSVRMQDIDHVPVIGNVSRLNKSRSGPNSLANSLCSLHCDTVQRLSLSFKLFLVWLCNLILCGTSISYCLSIIEQRVRLIGLVIVASQSNS